MNDNLTPRQIEAIELFGTVNDMQDIVKQN